MTKTNKSDVLLAFDKTSVRRTDTDGRLFLETSRISKAGVNPYWGREIPAWDELDLDPEKVYQVFRPPEELEKGAHTFNNIPILAIHTHVTAKNPKKEVIIGGTGSTASFDGEYLSNGLGFWDAEYIDKINDKKQRELSSSYRYKPILERGTYNGSPYDIRMTQIEGNHVALVVEGRAGPDVLVADTKIHIPEKVNTVPKSKIALLNAKQKSALKAHAVKLVAMDEADTEAAEEALEEALEEVQALGETPGADPATQDQEGGNAEVIALLKQVLAKLEGGNTSAADDTAEASANAEAAKNAAAADAAMDAKIKSATDDVKASIEGRFKAAEKVSPITGKLDAMAFDSAEAIFAHALKVGGMKPEDHKPEAYGGIVEVLIANKTTTVSGTANDEKTAADLKTMFPALSKINHA
jgi:hypothetical protein